MSDSIQELIDSTNELTNTVRGWVNSVDSKLTSALAQNEASTQAFTNNMDSKLDAFIASSPPVIGNFKQQIDIEGDVTRFYPVVVKKSSFWFSTISSVTGNYTEFNQKFRIICGKGEMPSDFHRGYMMLEFQASGFPATGTRDISDLLSHINYRRVLCGAIRQGLDGNNYSSNINDQLIVWLRGKHKYTIFSNAPFEFKVMCLDDNPTYYKTDRNLTNYLSTSFMYINSFSENYILDVRAKYSKVISSTDTYIDLDADSKIYNRSVVHGTRINDILGSIRNDSSTFAKVDVTARELADKLLLNKIPLAGASRRWSGTDNVFDKTITNDFSHIRWMAEPFMRYIDSRCHPELFAPYVDEKGVGLDRHVSQIFFDEPEFKELMELNLYDIPAGE